MTDHMCYYNQGREVPESAKKPIQGGRMNGKTDINPMWRIRKLTEMFGPCGIGWYYRSVREWLETYEKSVAAFVKIELYVRVGEEWSMPIQGTGGSMFVEQQKSGPYVSDECYKMATTDAISVACKQLGIGADVYWDRDPTKYTGGDGYGQLPDRNGKNQQGQMTGGSGQNRQGQSAESGPGQQMAMDPEIRRLREELAEELRRTGYGTAPVVRRYRVERIEQMTKLQLKDCVSKMKSVPDRDAAS